MAGELWKQVKKFWKAFVACETSLILKINELLFIFCLLLGHGKIRHTFLNGFKFISIFNLNSLNNDFQGQVVSLNLGHTISIIILLIRLSRRYVWILHDIWVESVSIRVTWNVLYLLNKQNVHEYSTPNFSGLLPHLIFNVETNWKKKPNSMKFHSRKCLRIKRIQKR